MNWSATVAICLKNDFSQIAFNVAQQATGAAPKPKKKAAPPVKKVAAKAG